MSLLMSPTTPTKLVLTGSTLEEESAMLCVQCDCNNFSLVASGCVLCCGQLIVAGGSLDMILNGLLYLEERPRA